VKFRWGELQVNFPGNNAPDDQAGSAGVHYFDGCGQGGFAGALEVLVIDVDGAVAIEGRKQDSLF
jgi:hypothetical protein